MFIVDCRYRVSKKRLLFSFEKRAKTIMDRHLYSYHHVIYFAIPINLVMTNALKTIEFSTSHFFEHDC